STRPAGIGFDGLWPASRGASTTSLRIPIEACRAALSTPGRTPRGTSPAATRAIAAGAMPSSSDGNGCVSRTHPARRPARDPSPGRGAPGASDVDDLLEVLDQVFDEPVPAVLDLGVDARDEGIEGDGGAPLVVLPGSADAR